MNSILIASALFAALVAAVQIGQAGQVVGGGHLGLLSVRVGRTGHR